MYVGYIPRSRGSWAQLCCYVHCYVHCYVNCYVNKCSFPTSSLNLEQNQLTSMSGLIRLPQLKVLCLNHNRVERLAPPSELGGGVVFPSLQVLHLAYNQLSSLLPLQLHRLTTLRALFLQGKGRGGEGVEKEG